MPERTSPLDESGVGAEEIAAPSTRAVGDVGAGFVPELAQLTVVMLWASTFVVAKAAFAEVSPLAAAIVRNAALMPMRWGRPKLMFDAPTVVFTFNSDQAIVELVDDDGNREAIGQRSDVGMTSLNMMVSAVSSMPDQAIAASWWANDVRIAGLMLAFSSANASPDSFTRIRS